MADFLWPPGLHGYWKSRQLNGFTDGAADAIAQFFARVPSKRAVVVDEHNGNGAMDRVADGATAFGQRGFPFNCVVTSA